MAQRKLAKYNEKRDFKKTAEPAGKVSRTKTGFGYLIQKHEASHLHYDFRLELDGVLKSWAVTKGPSVDPHDKRLAVEVEDHPVAYGSFEGVIPEGEYGGGTVMLWDEGTWEPIGDPRKELKKGSLHFNLHGKRLKGEWSLVRMKDRAKDRGRHNWLLIKRTDEFAKEGSGETFLARHKTSITTKRSMSKISKDADLVWKKGGVIQSKAPAPKKATAPKSNVKKLPALIAPQLATLTDSIPMGREWLHEVKFDGYRIMVYIENGKARMITRNGLDWTDKFGGLSDMLAGLPVKNAILDGELVSLDKENVSSFANLKIDLSKGGDHLSYYVFDLLYLDGKDLTKLPLIERKSKLEPLLKHADFPQIFYSEHFVSEHDGFLKHACALRLEGIISKLADAPYRSGRSKEWLKTKCHKRQEFVVGGYTLPSKGGPGIGAMLLGYYEGKDFVYAGRVGTGFDQAMSRTLRTKLKKIERKTMPYQKYSDGGRRGTSWKRDVIWVEPKLVCEVEFTEWTEDGALRHPSFQGLREDKAAKDVFRDVAVPTAAAKRIAKREVKKATRVKTLKAHAQDDAVTLSHPDRILFPDKGYTKQDLADYYVQVAEWMLPAIADRPLSLVRCPAGSKKHCFFQRHAGEGLSPHIHTLDIGSEKDREPYLMINDAAGLQALVQMGVLEIHNWGSHAKTWDKPDMIVFDFDPDEALPFSKVKQAASDIRARLQKLKLKSFLKTTGGKGLHVVVPFTPKHDWDTIKAFARSLAEEMADASPEPYTTNIRKAERKGRIFIDYLRNGETATAIAPYSTRARDGATVAVPLDWSELPALKKGNGWTIKTLPKRLAKLKHDPWETFYTAKQTLPIKKPRSK